MSDLRERLVASIMTVIGTSRSEGLADVILNVMRDVVREEMAASKYQLAVLEADVRGFSTGILERLAAIEQRMAYLQRQIDSESAAKTERINALEQRVAALEQLVNKQGE